MQHKDGPLLSVENLAVEFQTYGGAVQAVRGVNFEVNAGEVLAIVGESGCGKSVTCQSLMGLIPCPPGKVLSGRAMFLGRDLLAMKAREMEAIRGKEISMIFQDPLTSLNPTMTVGAQIAEVILKHQKLGGADCQKRTIELMQLVQIPESHRRVNQYPHEFSGGMRQRVMIAIALACRPKILIADEPTTALDVTIQGQILELLRDLQKEINMAVILITHNLGVVAAIADRVEVMYAGQIIESGSVNDIFKNPGHPYTLGLQKAVPNPLRKAQEALDLVAIPGSPPDLFKPPMGCGFAARCTYAMEVCESFMPPEHRISSGPGESAGRYTHCWLHNQNTPTSLKERFLDAGR